MDELTNHYRTSHCELKKALHSMREEANILSNDFKCQKTEIAELKAKLDEQLNQMQSLKSENCKISNLLQSQSDVVTHLRKSIEPRLNARSNELVSIGFELNANEQINRLKYQVEIKKRLQYQK